MKKTILLTISAALTLIFIFGIISCTKTTDNSELWESATYSKSTVFGNGEKTIDVEVTAEERTVTFTIKTDKKTVGAALLEHNLIDGEESEYGLYIKVVNGIVADYDVNQSYWAFYIDGEYATTGIDSTEITDGVKYQLVYTK